LKDFHILFQQIACIFEKEIRYALRDTDVLIYSVLVPLIIYPLFIIGAGEVLLWQASSKQQHYRVGFEKLQLPAYLDSALLMTKGFKFVTCEKPMEDLKAGKLDLVLNGSETADKYEITCIVGHKSGHVAAAKIRESLVTAQEQAKSRAFKEHKVPASLLRVFDVTKVRIVPDAAHKGAVETHSPLLLVGAVIIGLMQAGLVAGVCAVCMFAEEKEKKTYETTVSLPVSSSTLTAGKWLAATVLTLGSSLLYIVSVAMSYAVILLQLLASKTVALVEMAQLIKVEPVSASLAVLTVFLGSGLACAMCMLCVSSCKTFKDAQAIAMYPMFLLVSLPALAVIPGIEQTGWVNFVPLTNTLIALKHPQAGLTPLAMGLFETVLLILLCLLAASRIFFSEKSMFSGAGGAGKQSSQQQAESV
jgi:sodium transport system permease protein